MMDSVLLMWLCFASISHQRIISVAHFLPENNKKYYNDYEDNNCLKKD